MLRTFILFILLACFTESHAQLVKDLPLVPFPDDVIHKGYDFSIDESCVIIHLGNQKKIAKLLQAGIKERTGLELDLVRGPSPAMMDRRGIFITTATLSGAPSKEAYQLKVSENLIIVSGQTDEGAFRGVQTLLQLVPLQKGAFLFPSVEISDSPTFEHRGLLLDCSRHFWSVDLVKKYIDLLAHYKMNVLHWRLTDDRDWRIETDQFPALTKVASRRTETDSTHCGGFYSKEEIREIVAFARDRFITVIPEIEMPGHSLAALGAYPHLVCSEGPFKGSPTGGVVKNVYCAGNDSTYSFLETVLSEVMALFPSKYIHIGGKESSPYGWEECAQCQSRMKDEHLENVHELHSYFIDQIQEILSAHDRELIVWDEHLGEGLVEGATVQSGRRMEDAVRAGNKVIVSPATHCNLDLGLSAIDLEKTYSFDPIPVQLERPERQLIIGAECTMWTEHIPDEKTLDWHALPRLIGLAEVLWTYPQKRNLDWFRDRMNQQYKYLDHKKVNFGFESVPLRFETEFFDSKLFLKGIPQLEDVRAFYSTKGKMPRLNKKPLLAPIELEKDAFLQVLAAQNGRVYPEVFELSMTVNKANNQIITSNAMHSERYAAGGYQGLTDGFLGSLDFRDGYWQGYQGTDVRFEINLGYPRPISEVGAHFYHFHEAWIFPPASITISTSLDGVTFSDPQTVAYSGDLTKREPEINYLKTDYIRHTQFVRIEVKNMGPCPDWHEAAGSDSWIFIDEIIIR